MEKNKSKCSFCLITIRFQIYNRQHQLYISTAKCRHVQYRHEKCFWGDLFFFEIGRLRLPFTLVNIWTDRAIFSNNKLSICRVFLVFSFLTQTTCLANLTIIRVETELFRTAIRFQIYIVAKVRRPNYTVGAQCDMYVLIWSYSYEVITSKFYKCSWLKKVTRSKSQSDYWYQNFWLWTYYKCKNYFYSCYSSYI